MKKSGLIWRKVCKGPMDSLAEKTLHNLTALSFPPPLSLNCKHGRHRGISVLAPLKQTVPPTPPPTLPKPPSSSPLCSLFWTWDLKIAEVSHRQHSTEHWSHLRSLIITEAARRCWPLPASRYSDSLRLCLQPRATKGLWQAAQSLAWLLYLWLAYMPT